MEEVTKKMMEHLKEELEDVQEYHEMALEAEKHGHIRKARNLEKISMEEFTHAKYIRDTLIDAGAYVPEDHAECEEMWHRVRGMLFRKYR